MPNISLVRARAAGPLLQRALLVVLVVSFALVGLVRPAGADAGWDEAVRRKIYDDIDAAAHQDELVREVVWGWGSHSPADNFGEAVRRALWSNQDSAAHWNEAVRRYLWDQAHPSPESMLAAASAYQYKPGLEVWKIWPTPWPGDDSTHTVLGATFEGIAVVLFPAAFEHGQPFLNYVVAHESGHLWAHDHVADIAPVIALIDTYPNTTPDTERYADCYAQKKGLTRPNPFVGYWDCPQPVLDLVTTG